MEINSVDNKIKEYYDNQLPEPSRDKFEKILAEANRREQKQRQLKNNILKWGISLACCMIVALSIVLPIVLRKPNDPPDRYYASDNVNQVILTAEQSKQIIDSKYSKYSFLFEKYTFNYAGGYYTKDTNKLVGISINFSREDEPYTIVTFDLIMDNYFRLKNDEVYTKDAVETKNDSYTLYENQSFESGEMIYYKLFKYNNYKLYLTLNELDLDIFIQFL